MGSLEGLQRHPGDGKVAGVCVAFADRWRVDPVLVRILTVLLALSSGIGLVLYAAGWLAFPATGRDRAIIDDYLPQARRMPAPVAAVTILVACLLTTALIGGLLPFGITPALVIAAVWYFGCYRPQRARDRGAAAPGTSRGTAISPYTEQTPFTTAAAAWQDRVQGYLQLPDDRANGAPDASLPPAGRHHLPTTFSTAPGLDPTPADEPSGTRGFAGPAHVGPSNGPGYSLDAFLSHPDPVGLYRNPDEPPRSGSTSVARNKPRRRTGRMHVIGWALTLAALAAVGIADSYLEVQPYAYPAAALLALGVTLIIGTWMPRPRGLVIVGLIVAIMMGASMTPSPDVSGQQVSYRSVAEVPPGGTVAEVGSMTVDLSTLAMTGDLEHRVRVDAGELVVVVPRDATVRVNYSVSAGRAHILNAAELHGPDLSGTVIEPGPEGGPTLTLDASVDVGSLEVRR